MSSLADLSPEDRPRERLLAHGAHTLEANGLLALVLGTGRGSGEYALQLATRILKEAGGVDGLASSDPTALRRISGVGPVRAARIRAGFELAWRANPQEPLETPLDPAVVLAESVARLRGQVPPGEHLIFAHRPASAEPPITLVCGQDLNETSPLGGFLAQMLIEGPGPWWLVAVRPGGAPKAAERGAAEKVFASAAIVGLHLAKVLLIGGRRHWVLGEEG